VVRPIIREPLSSNLKVFVHTLPSRDRTPDRGSSGSSQCELAVLQQHQLARAWSKLLAHYHDVRERRDCLGKEQLQLAQRVRPRLKGSRNASCKEEEVRGEGTLVSPRNSKQSRGETSICTDLELPGESRDLPKLSWRHLPRAETYHTIPPRCGAKGPRSRR
jgi:hypothetical protein